MSEPPRFTRQLKLGGRVVEVLVKGGAAAPAIEGLPGHDRAGSAPQLEQPLDASFEEPEPDLAAVEWRAGGMAEALRIVFERSQAGARSLCEVPLDDPQVRAALERAGAEHGRRIWFLGRTGRRMWPEEIQCVAGCYEVLAAAAGLGRRVEELRGLEYSRRKEAYELVAEAQSALRQALRELAGLPRSDADQMEVFVWLRERVSHEGLFIERYMSSKDLANPWSWGARLARIEALQRGLEEALRRQRQVDELFELARYHALKIPQRRAPDGAWGDWSTIDQVFTWLTRLGLPATSKELREIVAPLVARLPAGFVAAETLRTVLLGVATLGEKARAREKERSRDTHVRRGQRAQSVLEIFQRAEAEHPERFAYRPNHQSDRDYPYERPEEVEAALHWLLGPYFETRAGKRRADYRELDRLLRQACGWSYKTTQSLTTVGQYRSWYETQLEGRRIAVYEHIGRGNTKRQAASSIRIGFAWDELTGKVVVGFVGQHQRNRSS